MLHRGGRVFESRGLLVGALTQVLMALSSIYKCLQILSVWVFEKTQRSCALQSYDSQDTARSHNRVTASVASNPRPGTTIFGDMSPSAFPSQESDAGSNTVNVVPRSTVH